MDLDTYLPNRERSRRGEATNERGTGEKAPRRQIESIVVIIVASAVDIDDIIRKVSVGLGLPAISGRGSRIHVHDVARF